MSVVDIPPGIGLAGTPLGTFRAPARARRLATITLVLTGVLTAVTWAFVAREPYRWHASTQFVLPISFTATCLLGFLIRRARLSVSRDGVRWGWTSIGFTQDVSRIVTAHVYRDGVALEAKRGSKWFLAARDWDRFDAMVRQLKRAELPVKDYDRKAPLRQRLQSYGRVLDGLLVVATIAGIGVALWAA